MRIHDQKNNLDLTKVVVYLTPDEMKDLANSSEYLALHPEKEHHHVADKDYTTEITIVALKSEIGS